MGARALVMVATLLPAFAPAAAEAAEAAVIIMYHRFGESQYPSTNIRLEQFEAHIKELTSGLYHVVAVPEIIDALRNGRPLPDRTVGITVDDAYLSVYTEAWPRLRKAGLPFTVFVATDPVDRGFSGLMTWDQIRTLAAAGVTIGHHSASHLHMPRNDLARDRSDLAKATARFEKELGRTPELFAYPYGEASLALENLVRESGFKAAFGQHSGAIGPSENFFYLPRFALNETYGSPERFRLVANALPLPVTDVTPADPLVAGNNPPAYGFTVKDGIGGLDRLRCFASHEGKLRIERLGESRIEVRMTKPFPRGRSRINCTLKTKDGRWRWFGEQFFVP